MQMKRGIVFAAVGLFMMSGIPQMFSCVAFEYVLSLRPCTTRLMPHEVARPSLPGRPGDLA